MNLWTRLLGRIDAGDVQGAVALLEQASEEEKDAVAEHLRHHFLVGGPRTLWWSDEPRYDEISVARVIGAACFGGAWQVEGWLSRFDLCLASGHREDADRILRLLRSRPVEWRVALAHGLARVSPSAGTYGGVRACRMSVWYLAAGLVEQTGIDPPDDTPFVLGWVQAMAGSNGSVVGDRLTRHLTSRLFHTRGLERVLSPDAGADPDTTRRWTAAMARLADEGVVERRTLIAGCLGAPFRDEPRPFMELYAVLRPDPVEIPVKDVVRLMPAASGPVMRLALAELRRADDAGLLSDELFRDTLEALAFRPEKKHVRTALSWAEAAVRRDRRRADAALRGVAVAFGGDARDLQERAVGVALRLHRNTEEPGHTVGHAPGDTAGPGRSRSSAGGTTPGPRPGRMGEQAAVSGYEAVRAAADGLPSDLRDRLASVFHLDRVSVQAPPALPPVVLATEPLPPVETTEELAVLAATARDPLEVERLLAALVRLTHRGREPIRAALEPQLRKDWETLFDPEHPGNGLGGMDSDFRFLTIRAVLAAAAPQAARRLRGLLVTYPPGADPMPDVIIRQRLREVAGALESAAVPVLLATPTSSSGHIDPLELVGRMERLEAAGAAPLPADFQQALVRLPREIDPAACARARNLSTPAGRALAAWLARGGLADPVVGCRIARLLPYRGAPEMVTRIFPSVRPREEDLPDLVRGLCALRPEPIALYSTTVEWWPLVMPSHREVIAAWMLPRIPGLAASRRADLSPLVHLCLGQGPAGAVSAAAIACGLGSAHEGSRGIAVDALLVQAARGDLPGEDLGRFLAALAEGGMVKLRHVIAALRDATAAGAHAEVWAAVAEMLAALLPEAAGRPRTGVTDLLGVGATAAALTGARGPVPRLAAAAARTGGGMFAREARRLQRLIDVEEEKP